MLSAKSFLVVLSALALTACLPGGKVDWTQVKDALDALPSVCYRDSKGHEVCVSRNEPPETMVLAGPEKECPK